MLESEKVSMAKLRSNWDWTLLQLVFVALNRLTYMAQRKVNSPKHMKDGEIFF